MKTLLVGELNPYGEDPAMALFPLPKHATGGRLCVILGLTGGEYLRRFDRTNLCTGTWSAYKAKSAADDIREYAGCWSRIVLLGSKVAKAFGEPCVPFSVRGKYAQIPHPSGRCRAWNDPAAAQRARDLILGSDDR